MYIIPRRYGAMGTFNVLVTIENKPGISDPEGDTILNDLVLRSGAKSVTSIRCSRNLQFAVNAESPADATAQVRAICDELRIYNPLVSVAKFSLV